MLKKTLLQTQFGSPHAWTVQYLREFERLADTGWELKVFTRNNLPSFRNVEIIPMGIEEFDALIELHCGVKVGNFITDKGVPSKLVSDFYPAMGSIFQDFLKDSDFWWISNWDCVYGNLSRFIPDSLLEDLDVYADEGCVAFNGIFSVMRNTCMVNDLYRQVPDWQESFTRHEPTAFDEVQFTHALRDLVARGEIRFGHPPNFGQHSYDRLIQHQPRPNLYFEEDGALIERYEDRTHFPARVGWHGREIPLFHFSQTKRWPL
jgi:hypothetical protein